MYQFTIHSENFSTYEITKEELESLKEEYNFKYDIDNMSIQDLQKIKEYIDADLVEENTIINEVVTLLHIKG